MKSKISILLLIFLVLTGCENRPIEFDDYDFQTIYFPIQSPVRTLELGESRFDNSIDLEHAFSIGVTLGGVYTNDIDRYVGFEYAPELASNVYVTVGPDTVMMQLLPESYYTLSSTDQFIIPAGEMIGKIRVELADAFFQDSLACTRNYILPLRLTEAEDSILSGSPAIGVDDPDPRIAEDWAVLPKNYVLFGIKYINQYHGSYLHRGVAFKKLSEEGEIVDTIYYSEQYLEKNQITHLNTTSLKSGTLDRLARNQGGVYTMTLTIDEGGEVAIDSIPGALHVTGSGMYFPSDNATAESWGGSSHGTMHLHYTYVNKGIYFECFDTLVYRDNGVVFEDFAPIIKE